MRWKDELKVLEQHKEWDFAIKLMEGVIERNTHDMDAYLFMNYLLMNLLVEEDYDDNKHDYYASLLLHYFQQSYEKFSGNPKYLFYSGRTAVMSEWYFNISQAEVKAMLQEALRLEPTNLLFQSKYYQDLALHEGDAHYNEISSYAEAILKPCSSVQEQLATMGSLGDYLWELLSNWAMDFRK